MIGVDLADKICFLALLRQNRASGTGPSPAAGVYRAFQELEERGVFQAPEPSRRELTCFAAPVLLPDSAVAVVGCMRADGGRRERVRLERECAAALAELASRMRDEAGRQQVRRSGASAN